MYVTLLKFHLLVIFPLLFSICFSVAFGQFLPIAVEILRYFYSKIEISAPSVEF